MSYVDGFVLAVPKKNLAAYRTLSRKAGKIWKEHGALEYRECVADDVKQKGSLSFPKSVKAKTGETIFFSWIVYKSRAHRDKVIKKVMADERLAAMMDPSKAIFDYKRMLYGGFTLVVDV
jgi:uncharacterized protein YbaA (DUF1428 family)